MTTQTHSKLFNLAVIVTLLMLMPHPLICQAEPQPLSNDHSAASSNDTDLDNVPLPGKYAHGMRNASRGPEAPDDPKARTEYLEAQRLEGKGIANLFLGRYQDATMYLNKSRLLWPDCAAIYRWLAEAYTGAGQTNEAIANYRLLFYGWPGRTTPSPDWTTLGRALVRPSNEPSDYKQPNPEESDPVLLLQFSLLLQQTNQFEEAKAAYNRAMIARTAEHTSSVQPDTDPLPPATSDALAPTELQVATLTQLAIYQLAVDRNDAEDELSAALLLKPKDPMASYYMAKVVQERENAQTPRHRH